MANQKEESEQDSGRNEPKKPSAFICFISSMLAPIGIAWAKRIQEELEQLKTKAREEVVDTAKEAAKPTDKQS